VLSRRAAVKFLAAASVGLTVGYYADLHTATVHAEPEPNMDLDDFIDDRFPALNLRIPRVDGASNGARDMRRDYHAVGDGSRDDGPAFRALAADVNAGRIPAGTVVTIPAGTYRVQGDEPVVFTRPVILRGAGAEATTIRIQYTQQGARFLRVCGQGMYEMHTSAVLPSGPIQGPAPQAPFSAVRGTPRRGDVSLQVERPDVFAPGDHVYLQCDDYGDEIVYAPGNRRRQHFLLKQQFSVSRVEHSTIWLDSAVRDDFPGDTRRLYCWLPVVGFGLEHVTIDDQSSIANSESMTTFVAVDLDGVADAWVWNVRFLNNTSIPLRLARSHRVIVSECPFHGARHTGAGGNGYLPQLFMTDDSLVEYSTCMGGRHALICDWSCWGNVFRYNRVLGEANIELHGEYSVENLYLRNYAPDATLDTGGGGDQTHAHDGPYNEAHGNLVASLRTLKRADSNARFIDNWYRDELADAGQGTLDQGNRRVQPSWTEYPYAALCGAERPLTRQTARPLAQGAAADAT
jgi:Pectate lyase superfamily protein